MAKYLFGALVRWSGLGALWRFLVARRRVTIVVYHDPSPEVMRAHLAHYARHHTFVTLDAVARAYANARWAALPRYPLVVTLDDGHAGNARLADVFREFGVRPTIFLCSQIVGTGRGFWFKSRAATAIGKDTLKHLPDGERRERLSHAGFDEAAPAESRQALSWDEARNLAEVIDFGAHTRFHPILPACGDAVATEEIALSKTEMEAALGAPCRHFAYPNGDYGDREVAVLRQAGFATARTVDVGWNGPDTDPFRLKGLLICDHASVTWLAAALTGLPQWTRTRIAALKRRVRGRRPALTGPGLPAGGTSPAA